MAIGGASREFMLKIVADVKDATKGIDQVETATSDMKSQITGMGKAVGGALAVGAVVAFGKESVNAAAEAEQAMNGVRTVFGDSADEIEEFSSRAITSMGISDDAYQAFATSTGGLLKDMGVPMEDTVKMTDELAQRGADLAAVYGVDADQAFTAMQKAMSGSTKGLKELGINISKNEIEAKAMSEGWVDAEGNVTSAGKAMATQALIMEKSSDEAGAFGEHSGEVANQQKILALQFEETQETIGTALLPVLSKLMAVFVPLLEFTAKYADILVPVAAGIGAVVLAYKAYTAAVWLQTAATTEGTAIQWLWNAAMSANPIVLVVIAIAAVVAAIILMYKKVDWFRAFVDTAIDGIVSAFNWFLDTVMGVYNWIKTNWPLLVAIITGPIGLAVLAVVKNWDTIKNTARAMIDAIKGFFSNVWQIISDPFKKGMDLALGFVDDVKEAFQKLPGQISGFFSNVANIIKAPFTTAFSAIKSWWNSTVGGFGFSVPSWVPGVGGKEFKIPHMASGGIVRGPTIALLGEAGPEAVIPLGKSGGFGTTVINVYALTANAEVGRRVFEALREYDRTSGRVA